MTTFLYAKGKLSFYGKGKLSLPANDDQEKKTLCLRASAFLFIHVALQCKNSRVLPLDDAKHTAKTASSLSKTR